jgi:FkbM family methyltransferase
MGCVSREPPGQSPNFVIFPTTKARWDCHGGSQAPLPLRACVMTGRCPVAPVEKRPQVNAQRSGLEFLILAHRARSHHRYDYPAQLRDIVTSHNAKDSDTLRRRIAQLLKRAARATLSEDLRLRISAARARRAASEPELALLRSLSKKGTFLDIGASIGAWTITAARSFDTVHAFEPNRSLARLLRATMPANVTVHEVALSNNTGNAVFYVPIHDNVEISTRGTLEVGANKGLAERVREVATAPLDSMSFSQIDVIKIDVEGHEGAVLEGAVRTIERERPSLIVEIEERHHPGRSLPIFDRFFQSEYSCSFIRQGRLESFQGEMLYGLQPASDMPPVGAKSPAYINNFIFVPRERPDVILAIEHQLAAQLA